MNILECSIFTKTQNKSQDNFYAMNNETHGHSFIMKYSTKTLTVHKSSLLILHIHTSKLMEKLHMFGLQVSVESLAQ